MTKIKLSKAIVLSFVTCTHLIASDVNLGTISVESSTIDEKIKTQQSQISSVATISAEEIKKINPKSVAELLNTIPGVTLTLSGTDSLKVHIRGVDNQRYMGEKPGVAIVIDSVPVQETTGKINVDLDNIESIKVIKGGASYLYGNDAIGGAVIITTKRQKGNGSRSKIESEFGSYGYKKLVASTNQALESGALQIQGSAKKTDGYWDDAYVKVKSINGKYQHYIDDSSDVTLGIDYSKRNTGDGNSVSGESEAIKNPTSAGYYSYGGYYNSDLTKNFITYNKDLNDDSNLMLRAHSYKDDKNYKLARYTRDNFEIWSQKGAKGEYRTNLGAFALMGGFDIQKNNTDEQSYTISTGALRSNYETKEDITALYTEVKHHSTESLITTINFRYDDIEHEYNDKEDNTNNVSPNYQTSSYRLGFNYSLNKLAQLYTNVSTGFRTPTVSQTSTNQVALKNDPTLNIPSEIDIEKTYNYEIGIKGETKNKLAYNASIFQLDRKDYIGKIAGNYITSADSDESNYDNVGDMRSRGFELAINSDKSKKLSYDLAYTFLQAKYTNYTISQQLTENTAGWGASNATYQRVNLAGNYVSRSPKHTANLSLDYKPTDKFSISPELYYKGSYYADEANRFKQKGYKIVNLRATYKQSKSLEFFGKINNLFDKKYYEFVNVNSSALATMEDATIRVAEPVTYYAGLRYNF